MLPDGERIATQQAAARALQSLALFTHLHPLLEVCCCLKFENVTLRIVKPLVQYQKRPTNAEYQIFPVGSFALQKEQLLEPLMSIEMPLVRVLADMEATGIATSPTALAAQKCAATPV